MKFTKPAWVMHKGTRTFSLTFQNPSSHTYQTHLVRAITLQNASPYSLFMSTPTAPVLPLVASTRESEYGALNLFLTPSQNSRIVPQSPYALLLCIPGLFSAYAGLIQADGLQV